MSRFHRAGAFAVLVLSFLSAPSALCDNHPATSADDVEVIRSGGINMYRYRDQNGNMVVVDRSPPQFFKTEAVAEVVEDVAEVPAEPPPVTPPPAPEPVSTIMPLLWLLPVVLLICALIVWWMPLLRRWRRETPVDRALRLAQLPVFNDLKISGVGGRFVVAERVVRTPAGLLILATSKLGGELRGAAGADQWVRGTTPVANPLKPVEQATAYLQAHVPGVPVVGRVVDLGKPRFAAGKPEALVSLDEFGATLAALDVPGPPVRTLEGAWRTLMKLPRANQTAIRPMGVGPLGWVRRHPHQAMAAALGSLALVMAITLAIAQLM